MSNNEESSMKDGLPYLVKEWKRIEPMSREVNQQWMDALKRVFSVKQKPFPLQDYQKALFDQMGESPKTIPAWPTLTSIMLGNGLKRGQLTSMEGHIVPKGNIPGKTMSLLDLIKDNPRILHVGYEGKSNFMGYMLKQLYETDPEKAKRYSEMMLGNQLNFEMPIVIDSYSQIVDSVRYPRTEPYSIDFTRKHFLYRDGVFNTLMNTPLERSMLRMETNPYVKTSRPKNISLLLAIRKLYRH